MNPLSRGIELGQSPSPTLRAARRMSDLQQAMKEVNRRPVGVDGIPYEAFTDPLGCVRWNPNLLDVFPTLEPLKTLQESLIENYIPDATQPFPMDKRILEKGTTANRIVERALSRKLNANLDRFFDDGSFGFRPHRSAEMAILQVRKAIRDGAHFAFETDFSHFFDSIDRSILERQLRATLPDLTLCDTLLSATAPARVTARGAVQRINGLPQGNGISPVLSNIYLHAFDEACSGFKYYRYADDLLVVGQTRQEVKAAKRAIRRLAGALGLQLNPNKTFIRDLYHQPVVFLGYELRGGNIHPPKKSIQEFQQKLEFRGQGDREGLMRAFVRRYHICCGVRMLFRRLDRDLQHLYPAGPYLVSMLESAPLTVTVGSIEVNKKDVTRKSGHLTLSHGPGCGSPDEKTVIGRPPLPAQQGQHVQLDALPWPNGKIHVLKEDQKMKDSRYLQFIRTRPCSFCGDPVVEPHHAIRTLRGISAAGLAQKGSDYLAIPMCRECHTKLHNGKFTADGAEIIEIIVINLICYLATLPRTQVGQTQTADEKDTT